MATKKDSLLTELSILRGHRKRASGGLAQQLDEEIRQVEDKLRSLSESHSVELGGFSI